MKTEVERMLKTYKHSETISVKAKDSAEVCSGYEEKTSIDLARTAIAGVYGGAGNGDNQSVVRRQMRRTHPSGRK